MHRNVVFFLLLGSLFTACKPEAPVSEVLTTEVYGRVVRRDTELKASNTPLTIRAYRDYIADDAPMGLWPPRTIKLMAETTTDTNGYYHLKFEADDLDRFGYYISLETNIPNHVQKTPGFWNRIGILPGQMQSKKIEITPLAWLRIKTRNLDSYPSDRLTIYFGNSEYNIWGPVERELLLMVAGNYKNIFSSALTRNGAIIATNFEVYTPAFDTTDFLIEY
jgi:hypothetical protein